MLISDPEGVIGLLSCFYCSGSGRTKRVTSLDFAPNGTELLASFSSNYVYLIDVQDVSEESLPVGSLQEEDGSGIAPMKKVRLRGDWSDTGPQARPERDRSSTQESPQGSQEDQGAASAPEAEEVAPIGPGAPGRSGSVINRFTELLRRWLERQLAGDESDHEGEEDNDDETGDRPSAPDEQTAGPSSEQGLATESPDQAAASASDRFEADWSDSNPSSPPIDDVVAAGTSTAAGEIVHERVSTPPEMDIFSQQNDADPHELPPPPAEDIGCRINVDWSFVNPDVETGDGAFAAMAGSNVAEVSARVRSPETPSGPPIPRLEASSDSDSLPSSSLSMEPLSPAGPLDHSPLLSPARCDDPACPECAHDTSPTGHCYNVHREESISDFSAKIDVRLNLSTRGTFGSTLRVKVETDEPNDDFSPPLEERVASTVSGSNPSGNPNEQPSTSDKPQLMTMPTIQIQEPEQEQEETTTTDPAQATVEGAQTEAPAVRPGLGLLAFRLRRSGAGQIGGEEVSEEERERNDRRREIVEKLEQEARKRQQKKDSSLRVLENVPQMKCKAVFKGHRNARTMLKQACFWGDRFVMSGSDCGHIFVWDRQTAKVVKVVEADRHVVNCLQPHPSLPLLASSGIDYDIKLWMPLEPEPHFDHEAAAEIMRRNEVMLEETRDTVTVPAAFMLRMLASMNRVRRRRRGEETGEDQAEGETASTAQAEDDGSGGVAETE